MKKRLCLIPLVVACLLALSAWSCDGGKYDHFWNGSTWVGRYELVGATGSYADSLGADRLCVARIRVNETYKGGTRGTLELLDAAHPERPLLTLDARFDDDSVRIYKGRLCGEPLSPSLITVTPDGDAVFGEGRRSDGDDTASISFSAERLQALLGAE